MELAQDPPKNTSDGTAIVTAADTSVNFHKHTKWLAHKKQYIIHIILLTTLICLFCGILFMVFVRPRKTIPEKVIYSKEIFKNGSETKKQSIQTTKLPLVTVSKSRSSEATPTSGKVKSTTSAVEITALQEAEEFNAAHTSFNFSSATTSVNYEGFDFTQCITVSTENKNCHRQIHRKSFQNDENIPTEDLVADLGHFMGWYPKHYNLNITVNRVSQVSFTGSVEIYSIATETTSSISVHAGRLISEIGLSQISAHNCHTGKVYCAVSIVYHQRYEVLSVEFAEPISAGDIIVLQIQNFSSFGASDGLIVKSPEVWEPKRPWTVTTFFQLRNARTVFPCFDLPVMKASLNLCVNHPFGTEARSNTKLSHISKNLNEIESCFERTPPLSSYVYAFTVFDKMSSLKDAAKPHEYLPEVEVLYSEEDSIVKPDWISTETVHALKVMANISNFRYPLNKLSLMASYLPVYGLENLGLVILDERFVAYPKYRLAHTILAHEIAQHWIGSIVTVKKWKEICLQEGLSTYLEWIITASFDNSTYLNELINEKRRESITKDSTTSTIIISDFQSYQDISRCFDKSAIFFAMLELGFGPGTVVRLVRILMQRYSYANAGFAEWRKVIEEVSGNVVAGEFFEKYFTQPGLPLIHVSSTSQQLTLTQDITALKQPINANVTTDASPTRSTLILTEKRQMFEVKNAGLVVVDPDGRTHTVIVYEIEIYSNFTNCLQQSACQVLLKPETMKRILDDFCWALLADHFSVPEDQPDKAQVWTQFMDTFSQTNYVRGVCACCMNKKLEKSGTISCRWHWRDVCENLRLIKQIRYLTL
ncbi:unnamed protein product [Thelazia callipaeda]|uniref:Aminopeptidase n=1 Tax=Thelazia callipaeda TaxID=103827 RepID=A0A0N5D8W6_THECL|nr:unnamed protein product [Thelazia callipaeda]